VGRPAERDWLLRVADGRCQLSDVPVDVVTSPVSPLLAEGIAGRTIRVAAPRFAAGRRAATVEQGETSVFTRLYSCQADGEGLE